MSITNKLCACVVLLAAVATVYFTAKLIIAVLRKEPVKPSVKKICVSIAVVLTSLVLAGLTQTPEDRALIQARKEARLKAEGDKKLAEEKRQAEEQAAKLEAERKAKEEEERLAAEIELKNRQEAERKAKLEEERAAREAELYETLPTVDEFNDSLVAYFSRLGVGRMSEPQRANNRLVYPLDNSGELFLTMTLLNNEKVKSVSVDITNVNKGTMTAAIVFYDAAIKALNPSADTNAIFGSLHLDATIMEWLKKSSATTLNGFSYSKQWYDKTLKLSASAQ